MTRRYARLGNSVQRGDKLFEVARAGALQVRFDLTGVMVSSPDVGTRVDLLDSLNGRVIGAALIHSVHPSGLSPDTRSYLAAIVEGSGLGVGTALGVHLPGAAGAASIAIPQAAFPVGSRLAAGESATIFVVLTDGTCAPRVVRVETVVNGQVRVSSGIATGDRIVLAPPFELRPGELAEVSRETTGY